MRGGLTACTATRARARCFAEEYGKLTSKQRMFFLDSLLAAAPLDHKTFGGRRASPSAREENGAHTCVYVRALRCADKLNELYALGASPNVEVCFRYVMIGLKSNHR